MTRVGFTLVELVLAVAVLGIAAGVAAVALRASAPTASRGWRDELLEARSRAIRSATIVSGVLDSVGRYTAFPNGLVVTDSAPGNLPFLPPAHAR